MGAEQEVARAQRVAFAVEDLADPAAQAARARGGCCLEHGLDRAVGPLEADGQRPGRGGAGDDVVGRHEPAEAFFQLRQDGGGVGVGEPVGLVEDDDRALSLANQGRQRLVLGADQVVVEHENQQVGARSQVAGFPLALRAGLAHFRQARRVGQEDGPLDPFQRIGMVLGPLGRAHGRLGLAGFAAEQCVDQATSCRPSRCRRRRRETRGGSARLGSRSAPGSSRPWRTASVTCRITSSACSAWTAAAWIMSSGA